jgi:hypothetical protein
LLKFEIHISENPFVVKLSAYFTQPDVHGFFSSEI